MIARLVIAAALLASGSALSAFHNRTRLRRNRPKARPLKMLRCGRASRPCSAAD